MKRLLFHLHRQFKGNTRAAHRSHLWCFEAALHVKNCLHWGVSKHQLGVSEQKFISSFLCLNLSHIYYSNLYLLLIFFVPRILCLSGDRVLVQRSPALKKTAVTMQMNFSRLTPQDLQQATLLFSLWERGSLRHGKRLLRSAQLCAGQSHTFHQYDTSLWCICCSLMMSLCVFHQDRHGNGCTRCQVCGMTTFSRYMQRHHNTRGQSLRYRCV